MNLQYEKMKKDALSQLKSAVDFSKAHSAINITVNAHDLELALRQIKEVTKENERLRECMKEADAAFVRIREYANKLGCRGSGSGSVAAHSFSEAMGWLNKYSDLMGGK